MKKIRKKKLKNPLLLFVPILLEMIVVFTLDWITGPHTGPIHPPLEYCGHYRGTASFGAMPHFHCMNDQFPLLVALLRFLAFICFLVIGIFMMIGVMIFPIIIFLVVSGKTKSNIIGFGAFFLVLLLEIGTYLLYWNPNFFF